MLKHFIVIIALLFPLTTISAVTTSDNLSIRKVLFKVDPNERVIRVTNRNKSTIQVMRTILIEDGKYCNTKAPPVTIKPDQTVLINEGDDCSTWASNGVMLATPKGIIKHTW